MVKARSGSVKKNSNKLILFFSVLLSVDASASPVGLPDPGNFNRPLREQSRSCCNFVGGWLFEHLGLSGMMDPKDLGAHFYSRSLDRKDRVGMIYTCRGGFVDISHARDNADWAADLLNRLLHRDSQIGVKIPIALEGGSSERMLEIFPWSEEMVRKLTPADYQKLAIAWTFDIALLHEISTSFAITVTKKRIPLITDRLLSQRRSAFSIEDAYSNLLGAHLGTEAYLREEDYNSAMEILLRERVENLGGQSEAIGRAIHQSLKSSWWEKGLGYSGYHQLLQRDYQIDLKVTPKLAPSKSCESLSGNSFDPIQPNSLEIPNQVAGKPIEVFGQVVMTPTPLLRRHFKKLGIRVGSEITRKDFPEIISKIRANFDVIH
jgi:hypothetical protein